VLPDPGRESIRRDRNCTIALDNELARQGRAVSVLGGARSAGDRHAALMATPSAAAGVVEEDSCVVEDVAQNGAFRRFNGYSKRLNPYMGHYTDTMSFTGMEQDDPLTGRQDNPVWVVDSCSVSGVLQDDSSSRSSNPLSVGFFQKFAMLLRGLAFEADMAGSMTAMKRKSFGESRINRLSSKSPQNWLILPIRQGEGSIKEVEAAAFASPFSYLFRGI